MVKEMLGKSSILLSRSSDTCLTCVFEMYDGQGNAGKVKHTDVAVK